VNRGSFGATDSVYAYVCTETNSCSAGFAITLGPAADSTGPVRIRRPGDLLYAGMGLLPVAWWWKRRAA